MNRCLLAARWTSGFSLPADAQPCRTKRIRLAVTWASIAFVSLMVAPPARAYVEAPHTLGRCCHESTNVVLVEVTRVDKAKGLIIYKKIEDLKGKHAQDSIKHNIGTRGFHEREWKTIICLLYTSPSPRDS